ncbi:tetratricopeptide repeat protein [Candidatus Reidiella endopervernicosa]|nr:tetratricopeptide repeat protein [Candidatus Reidiella endopervernicosa]
MEVNSPKRAELLDQSAEILKKVIESNPQSLDAHRKLMGVYLLKQDYSNGIRTMQDAITLSPEDPKLFITLAFLYEHSGSFEYASAMLDQALALDPNHKLAKEYKIAIKQKIAQRNMDQLHEGKEIEGNPHGQGKSHGQSDPHGKSAELSPIPVEVKK